MLDLNQGNILHSQLRRKKKKLLENKHNLSHRLRTPHPTPAPPLVDPTNHAGISNMLGFPLPPRLPLHQWTSPLSSGTPTLGPGTWHQGSTSLRGPCNLPAFFSAARTAATWASPHITGCQPVTVWTTALHADPKETLSSPKIFTSRCLFNCGWVFSSS